MFIRDLYLFRLYLSSSNTKLFLGSKIDKSANQSRAASPSISGPSSPVSDSSRRTPQVPPSTRFDLSLKHLHYIYIEKLRMLYSYICYSLMIVTRNTIICS